MSIFRKTLELDILDEKLENTFIKFDEFMAYDNRTSFIYFVDSFYNMIKYVDQRINLITENNLNHMFSFIKKITPFRQAFNHIKTKVNKEQFNSDSWESNFELYNTAIQAIIVIQKKMDRVLNSTFNDEVESKKAFNKLVSKVEYENLSDEEKNKK